MQSSSEETSSVGHREVVGTSNSHAPRTVVKTSLTEVGGTTGNMVETEGNAVPAEGVTAEVVTETTTAEVVPRSGTENQDLVSDASGNCV